MSAGRIVCPECDGSGRGDIVAECCGNMTRAGDCCGEPIAAQERCQICHGDGMVDGRDDAEAPA